MNLALTFTQPELGFGWQAVFIAALVAMYPSYYWEELQVASDLLGRVASYILLIALTVTSFSCAPKKTPQAQQFGTEACLVRLIHTRCWERQCCTLDRHRLNGARITHGAQICGHILRLHQRLITRH